MSMTAEMAKINPVNASTVLGWCEGCGNVIAFTPRGLEAHAKTCPGRVSNGD